MLFIDHSSRQDAFSFNPKIVTFMGLIMSLPRIFQAQGWEWLIIKIPEYTLHPYHILTVCIMIRTFYFSEKPPKSLNSADSQTILLLSHIEIDWLCWGLTTWVILSSPREREKRDRTDSRGEEREWHRRKLKLKESEGTEEITTIPSTLTCCKDSRPCLTVSQYHLGTPVTKTTEQLPPMSCWDGVWLW